MLGGVRRRSNRTGQGPTSPCTGLDEPGPGKSGCTPGDLIPARRPHSRHPCVFTEADLLMQGVQLAADALGSNPEGYGRQPPPGG